MGTVTIRPELMAALDEITQGDAKKREALVNDTLEQFLTGREEDAELAAPDWHIPLVKEGLKSARRGEFVEFDLDKLIARGRNA